jgi:hypothetical protein
MKLLGLFSFGLLAVLEVIGGSAEEPEKDSVAPCTQDLVMLDLDTGNLQYDYEAISLERLETLFEQSNSICLNATSFSGATTVVPASYILSVLEMIDRLGIEPAQIQLNLFLQTEYRRNQYHLLELKGDRQIALNHSELLTYEFSPKFSPKAPFYMVAESKSSIGNYRQLLSVLRAMGSDAELVGLAIGDPKAVELDMVKVKATIYQMNDDGTEKLLSAPYLTVVSGRPAMVKVVDSGTTRKTYLPGTDPFLQEDLSNLGTHLSVKPQIMGDHIWVSGTATLIKLEDRVGVFVDGATPIASYTSTKTVVPFSFMFPPGTDTVQFPVAEVDGRETQCRLSAQIIDGYGLTQRQREKIRAWARP